MPRKFDYTTRARRMALKYPLLSDIGTQITYWIFAFSLYFTLVNYISKAVASLFDLNAKTHMTENIIISVIGGIVFGTVLGLIDFYIERKFVRRSLGLELLVKYFLYAIAWFIVVPVARNVGLAIDAKFIDNASVNYTKHFFSNMGLSGTIFTMVMIAGISFIKQMNNKFGPGIILPMLFGKYRNPREEERIFMFMDLKSSTSYAEKLGHLKYSLMIQRCFRDVNKVIPKFFAEVYQYVGDEVVLTWTKEEGLKNLNCIKFYFAFKEQLEKNKNKYEEEFGLIPEFKASVHQGKITVTEVGDIKREIAYHGDTINIAARIQSMCNSYNKNFLISETLKESLQSENSIVIEFVDETILKGKTENIKIYSVDNTELF
jgi:adenylate cyclase